MANERGFITTGDVNGLAHNIESKERTVDGDLVKNPVYALDDETLQYLQTMFGTFATSDQQTAANAALQTISSQLAATLLALRAIGPATSHVAVTPDDDTDLSASGIRRLYIGGAGTVAIRVNGVTVSYDVPDGTTLDVVVQRVLDTGTTATDIVGIV